MYLTCSICFDYLFTGEEAELIYATQCGHIFHYECLEQWIHSSNTCPHCRQNVSSNNIIKLNVMSQCEPLPSSDNERITRSTVMNRQQNHLVETELALKNSQLDLKIRELGLKSIELKRIEKKYKTVENRYEAVERENEKWKLENKALKLEISRLKTDLEYAVERSTIIRSDLRIMDIIDLESDSYGLDGENAIDLTK